MSALVDPGRAHRRGAALVAGLGALAASLGGCARVIVSEGARESGLRVDPPRPYLLVTAPASPPGIPPARRTAELVLLPDLDHSQWVRVRAGLGAVSARITLAHGMLAAYEEDVDAKGAETLAAAAEALPKALDARGEAVAGPGAALATTIELLEIRARPDGDVELIPVAPERARRLLARVRSAPPTQRVRVGP